MQPAPALPESHRLRGSSKCRAPRFALCPAHTLKIEPARKHCQRWLAHASSFAPAAFNACNENPTHRTNVSARDTQAFFDPNQGSYETRTQTKNKEHILDGSDHEEPAHRISHLESGKAPAKASGTSYFHSRTGAGQPIMTIRTGITAAFQQTRL